MRSYYMEGWTWAENNPDERSSVSCVIALDKEYCLTNMQKEWVRQGFKDQRASHERYGKEAQQKKREAESYSGKRRK